MCFEFAFVPAQRNAFFCSDGGEEEEEAVGQNGLLAAAQHCGQSDHQETGREVPQEEGCHHGNNALYLFWVESMLKCIEGKKRRQLLKAVVPFVVGGARQIWSGGEDDRLRRQTEIGPESCRDSHTGTR